jgi:predicted aspartyl protease
MSSKRPTTANYTDVEAFIGNRPHSVSVAVVTLKYRSPVFANALVDTGADHSVLPVRVARAAKLTIPAAKMFPTLGGSVRVHEVRNCTLEVEGMTVRVTVLFDPSGTLAPILGRDALLARCEFGFNSSEWMWD